MTDEIDALFKGLLPIKEVFLPVSVMITSLTTLGTLKRPPF